MKHKVETIAAKSAKTSTNLEGTPVSTRLPKDVFTILANEALEADRTIAAQVRRIVVSHYEGATS